MKSRNPEQYGGAILALVWVSIIIFGITFWVGVACLIGRIFQ